VILKVTGKPVAVDVPDDSDDSQVNKMDIIVEKLYAIE